MGMFDRFEKPPATQSFRITDKGTDAIRTSKGEDISTILLAISTSGSQSLASLQRTGIPPDSIKRSLRQLRQAGLIAPVKS